MHHAPSRAWSRAQTGNVCEAGRAGDTGGTGQLVSMGSNGRRRELAQGWSQNRPPCAPQAWRSRAVPVVPGHGLGPYQHRCCAGLRDELRPGPCHSRGVTSPGSCNSHGRCLQLGAPTLVSHQHSRLQRGNAPSGRGSSRHISKLDEPPEHGSGPAQPG